MTIEILITLFIITFVAAVVQGISGFAFGIVMLMVLPHFFNYTDALALVSLMTVFVFSYNTYLYRKHINWQLVPAAIISYIVVDIFAVRLLKYVGDAPIWHTLLGILFIAMAAYMMYGQGRVTIKPTVANAVIFNGVGGLVNGLFGAGGPIAAAYFLVAAKSKEEYLGTTQIVFFFNMLADVILRFLNGMYTPTLIFYGLSGLWCVVIGLLVGKKLFSLMNIDTMRKIICGLMVLNGIVMLLK